MIRRAAWAAVLAGFVGAIAAVSLAFLVALLSSVSARSVFGETAEQTHIAPTQARFVSFGEWASIRNDDVKDQTVLELRSWIEDVQPLPWNIEGNIFNILFRGNEWDAHEIMVTDRYKGRILSISLVATSDADVFYNRCQFSSIGHTVNKGGVFLNDLLWESPMRRSIRNCGLMADQSPNEDIRSFGYLDSVGGGLSRFRGNLCRLQGEKDQETLASADDDQSSSKNDQQEIKPPPRIIWWRRGMVSFVLLCSSIYAVRNGLLNLLRGQNIRGWGWLCGALLCAEAASFVMWLGFGISQ